MNKIFFFFRKKIQYLSVPVSTAQLMMVYVCQHVYFTHFVHWAPCCSEIRQLPRLCLCRLHAAVMWPQTGSVCASFVRQSLFEVCRRHALLRRSNSRQSQSRTTSLSPTKQLSTCVDLRVFLAWRDLTFLWDSASSSLTGIRYNLRPITTEDKLTFGGDSN